MNKFFVRAVASLIASNVLVCASTASIAQPWAGVASVTGVEFGTKDEAGNCQVLRNGQTSCRYYMTGKTSEINDLDGFAARPGLQLKRTGETIQGFPPGTPGTVTMRKLMFCLGGTINPSAPNVPEQSGAVRCYTENTVYSHVITPEKARQNGTSDVLVDNPTLSYFTAPQWTGYVEDQGDVGLAFVLPYKQMIAGREYAFCPTGTRDVRKWYNNAFARSSASASVINDGNWRFSNNFAWRDPSANGTSSLPKGYESSIDDELLCGPAEVSKAWLNNGYPTDLVYENGVEARAKFVSRIILGLTPTTANVREDIVSQEPNRQNWFDNSRNIFYTPGFNPVWIVTAKNANAPATNAVASIIETASGLGVYVHERNGRVYQLGTFFDFNRVTVSPTNQASVPNPKVLAQSVTNNRLVEANVAGHIEGDLFFRVLATNSWTSGRVEVYDLRLGEVGMKIAEYVIPFQLALAGSVDAFRPELSYDSRRNELYILNVQHGKLFALNFASGNTREVMVANQNGDSLTDVVIDTAHDVLLVLAIPTANNSANADNRNSFAGAGRLLEQSLVSGALRQISTDAFPWAIALGNVSGLSTAFVSCQVTRKLVEIDLQTLTRRRETTTEQQPMTIVLELKK